MPRPRKYSTDEERLQARRAQKAAYMRRRRARKPPLRSFLAYDAEGEGDRLILLGHSRDYISSRKGLSSASCLAFLTRPEEGNPHRVFFAFGYDVAHILRDLPFELQVRLYHGERLTWKAWELRFIPRKMLEIRSNRGRFVYTDCWTFFHSSLEAALRKHLGHVPRVISQGKRARADFAGWPMDHIRAYHQAECEATERLLDKLRDAFQTGDPDLPDLTPHSWHGPGAVATRVLRAANVAEHVYPERGLADTLRDAFARAYFGGRIETYCIGRVRGKVYRYDIRSAYPDAIRSLPRLTWRWYKARRFEVDSPFSVWHVRWDLRGEPLAQVGPGPFPWRDDRGYITFRAEGEGWYWWPEVREALRLFRGVEVLEGYVMRPSGVYPLRDLVERLYAARRELASADDPRELAIKLALNSLYGKMAQKEGAARYRSIAWAGYVTSHCRARMLAALATARHPVYAVLTDGILSAGPLKVPLGEDLGEWERSTYQGALILLPGVYRLGRAKDRNRVERWRGYNVRSFPYGRVLREIRDRGAAQLECGLFVSPPMAALGPQAYGPHLRTFITVSRHVDPLGQHKRLYASPGPVDGHPGPDLGRRLLWSRMVASPHDDWPGESAPYTAFTISELGSAERDALEEAIGQGTGG